MPRQGASVLLCALLLSCGDEKAKAPVPPPPPVPQGVFGDDWKPRPRVAECAGCVPLFENLPVGHMGGVGLSLSYDPSREDPITRWGECLQAVVDCAESQAPLPDCVKGAAPCPAACRDLYASRIAGGEEVLTAFRELFLREGARCYPTPPGVVP